jgi:hypothetical protein
MNVCTIVVLQIGQLENSSSLEKASLNVPHSPILCRYFFVTNKSFQYSLIKNIDEVYYSLGYSAA